MELVTICLIFLQIIRGLAATTNIILVTDLDGSIFTGPIDTLQLEKIPLLGVSRPVGISYDPVEQKVYWTDDVTKSISRAFLNGTAQEEVVSLSGLSVPEGITIDVENRQIYWTDAGTSRIERANLDGSGREVILQDGHDQLRAIVVDSNDRHLYWTDWGANKKIERAKVDGSERIVLVDTDLQNPNGLTIDFAERQLYWCDAGRNIIETTDLEGRNRTVIYHSPTQDISPFDIAIYNEDIYWSDWSFPKLRRLDRHAIRQEAEAVGPALFTQAGGLHIQQDINECDQVPSVCHINASCMDTHSSYNCECQAGYVGDGKVSCSDIDECDPQPCENEGTCVDKINDFDCACIDGFTGNRCEIDIDECEPQPCENGGTCVDKINNFDCACMDGFTGNRCEIALSDPCGIQPCMNEATCQSSGDQFTCQCEPGYTGDICETDIDECTPQPCENRGTCVDSINAFYCACVNGYTGDRCENEAPSTSEPTGCQHQGSLQNGYVIPDRSLYAPGEKVKYVCDEDYIREGPQESFCQKDFTWSHRSPICVLENGADGAYVVIGAGVGGGLTVLIVAIILIIVCYTKSQKPAHNRTTHRNSDNPTYDTPVHNTYLTTMTCTKNIHAFEKEEPMELPDRYPPPPPYNDPINEGYNGEHAYATVIENSSNI